MTIQTQIELWTKQDGECFRYLFGLSKPQFLIMPPSSWNWLADLCKFMQGINTPHTAAELLENEDPAITKFKAVATTYLTGKYSWLGLPNTNVATLFFYLLRPYKRNLTTNIRYTSGVWNDLGESLGSCLDEANLLPKPKPTKRKKIMDMSHLSEEAKEILRRTAKDYGLPLEDEPTTAEEVTEESAD